MIEEVTDYGVSEEKHDWFSETNANAMLLLLLLQQQYIQSTLVAAVEAVMGCREATGEWKH